MTVADILTNWIPSQQDLYVSKLVLWFIMYSFAGWVYESILVSIQEGKPVNRGFLNGPLCPIYGAGAVTAVLLLDPSYNIPVLFLSSALGASIIEYVTSLAMEKAFNARWWDYSHFRFNIEGRVCLLGAIVFGVMGVIITDVVQPFVSRITGMLSDDVIIISSLALAFAVFIDFMVTITGLIGFSENVAKAGMRLKQEMEKAKANMLSALPPFITSMNENDEAMSKAMATIDGDNADMMRSIPTSSVKDWSSALKAYSRIRRVSMPDIKVPVDSISRALKASMTNQQLRMIRNFPKFTFTDGVGVQLAPVMRRLRDVVTRAKSNDQSAEEGEDKGR